MTAWDAWNYRSKSTYGYYRKWTYGYYAVRDAIYYLHVKKSSRQGRVNAVTFGDVRNAVNKTLDKIWLRKPALMKAKAAFMSNKFFSFFSEYRRYSLAQIKSNQM